MHARPLLGTLAMESSQLNAFKPNDEKPIKVIGRQGYLAPLGFAMAMPVLGNVLAKTGWAPWFPWSIVPLLIGMVGQPAQTLPPGSFVVLALTFAAGIAATIWWFTYADCNQ